STNIGLERCRERRGSLRSGDTSVKDVVDDNEEEFTEEKEAELTRVVVNAFGNVDKLLRERDQLVDKARKLRAKAGPKAKRKTRGKAKDPAWRTFELQATQRRQK